MTLRTALKEARVLTLAILFAGLWTLLTIMDVAGAFDWAAIDTADYVGPTAVGGIVGLLVMLGVLLLLVGLYGEVTEMDPAPDTWPPE